MAGNSVNLGSAYGTITIDTDGVQRNLDNATRRMGVFQQSASRAGAIASGAFRAAALGVTAAVGSMGVGMLAAGAAGLNMNRQMENVSAQLNALTKDGEVTAGILEMIRERAARTPFAFGEMADAAAGLLPAAKQAGVGLESLIQQAEILAASNPAQGLEGAAFALREAVSGDFTSIIERFNLPRSYINQLREEGVPNLEIVQRAMQELGYDAELVANLAETASGRWSTFKDTFTSLASRVTQPIFDRLSSALGDINAWLTANEDKFSAFADMLAGRVAGAIDLIGRVISPLLTAFNRIRQGMDPITALSGALYQIVEALGLGEQTAGRFAAAFRWAAGLVRAAFANVRDMIVNVVEAIRSGDWAGAANAAIGGITGGFSVLFERVAPHLVAWYGAIRDWVLSVDWAGVIAGVLGYMAAKFAELWAWVQPKLAAFYQAVLAWFLETDWSGLAVTAITFIAEKLGELWAWVQPKLSAFFASVGEWFTNADWDAQGRLVIDKIVTELQEFWSVAEPVLTSWLESIRAWFTDTDWRALGRQVIDEIVTELGEFWTAALPKLEGWWTSVQTWWNGVDWESLGYNVVTWILEKLADMARWEQEVKAWLNSLFANIGSNASKIDWGQVGRTIIEAIAAGVRFNNAIRDALMDMARGAWQAIANFFRNPGGGSGGASGASGAASGGGRSGAQSVYTGAMAASFFRQAAATNARAAAMNGSHSLSQRSGAPGVVVESMNVTINGRDIDQYGAARAIENGMRRATADIWRENRARGVP